MNETQVSEALRDWALEVLDPDLLAARAYVSAQKSLLPDVMVNVTEKRITSGPEAAFPFQELQQRDLRVFDAELSFLVEHGDDDDADEEETQALQGFGARLEVAIVTDATLNGRVQMASPYCSFDYSSPFIEYPDRTRGRQMVLSMSVAELVEVQP